MKSNKEGLQIYCLWYSFDVNISALSHSKLQIFVINPRISARKIPHYHKLIESEKKKLLPLYYFLSYGTDVKH